jgi:hypothetical protein
MGSYWRLLGEYDAETQAWSACVGAMQTSPYIPDENATLKGVRVIIGQQAATTLTTGVQIRISATTFKPNTMHVFGQGSGLRTAPGTIPPQYDYACDQPVVAGVPVTVEGRCSDATAVTNDVFIMGRFES